VIFFRIRIGSGFNDFVDPHKESGSRIRIQVREKEEKQYFLLHFVQFYNKKACFGSWFGSALYPDSKNLWIRILIRIEIRCWTRVPVLKHAVHKNKTKKTFFYNVGVYRYQKTKNFTYSRIKKYNFSFRKMHLPKVIPK
jgi:hypothetical protein